MRKLALLIATSVSLLLPRLAQADWGESTTDNDPQTGAWADAYRHGHRDQDAQVAPGTPLDPSR